MTQVAAQWIAVQWSRIASRSLVLSLDDRLLGQCLFIAVFVLLIVLLLWIPDERLGHARSRPSWCFNVRIWAVLIAATQIVVYAVWSYRG